ncbi:sodium-dependent transporter [Nitrosopumilus piranensis]|uniref:Transporter n=1 Tax=Nitrosopumilus piranensis TaxID=1582439 RepID=A0A0C5BVM8_9ARCH|nr:sodium-dependent transporter [Nitrosopumilus piranensis]AJM92299.1 Transporter [Nitrosopumilus piranensis]
MESEVKREEWKSTSGFILACIGSAVGVANIWRFPYIVGENGGGAFLVPFLIVVVGLGVILMMLEFSVGKYFQSSIVNSLKRIRTKLKWFGVLIASVSLVILSYYLVIIGWIGFYLSSFLVSNVLGFEDLAQTYFSLISFVVVTLIVVSIVNKGVIHGIEKFNKIAVVFLIAILIPFTIYAITLPNAMEGITYFLRPDFSSLVNPEIWTTALGQAFFSLSLGSGAMLTYGSYLGKRQFLLKPTSTIIVTNTGVSILAGIIIFSLVFSNAQSPSQGLPLVFNILPEIFSNIDYGMQIGAIFFSLLFVAGITSAIGLFQVPMASVQESFRTSRRKAAFFVLVLVLMFGIPSALSYSPISLEFQEEKFLDLLDKIFGTYGITIAELVFVISVAWFMKKKRILENLNKNSRYNFPDWTIHVLKFVAPMLIILTVVSSILSENF